MGQSPKSAKNGDMRINPALVRELAQLLTDNELTEIEVADGDRRIKVKRDTPAMIAAAHMAPAMAVPQAPALSAGAAGTAAEGAMCAAAIIAGASRFTLIRRSPSATSISVSSLSLSSCASSRTSAGLIRISPFFAPFGDWAILTVPY
jgi:acetyl-CoA carboxylase biotin carboxyl carrier protein